MKLTSCSLSISSPLLLLAVSACQADNLEQIFSNPPEPARPGIFAAASRLPRYADPDKLSQVMINLLTNALNATERGGKISVRAWRDKEGFSLEVSDTGQGLKDDDLPFIFERFYTTFTEGLGLGLAIAKELVQAHGGSIEAKSEYGRGATFTVRLPHS